MLDNCEHLLARRHSSSTDRAVVPGDVRSSRPAAKGWRASVSSRSPCRSLEPVTSRGGPSCSPNGLEQSAESGFAPRPRRPSRSSAPPRRHPPRDRARRGTHPHDESPGDRGAPRRAVPAPDGRQPHRGGTPPDAAPGCRLELRPARRTRPHDPRSPRRVLGRVHPDAAEAVVAGDDLNALDVLDGVAQLVDKSLVVADRETSRHPLPPPRNHSPVRAGTPRGPCCHRRDAPTPRHVVRRVHRGGERRSAWTRRGGMAGAVRAPRSTTSGPH